MLELNYSKKEIEITDKKGEKFKAGTDLKLKPQKIYFLMNSKVMEMFS